MAWISLAKILIIVFGLAYLIANKAKNQCEPVSKVLWTPWAILATLFAFSLSLVWTGADQEVALQTLVKHGKLLEILVLISLIRTAQEARVAMTAFAAGQAVLLLSSWSMATGIPIPWTTSSGSKYVVFSTYLDQSIIFATAAGVFWHLRSDSLWPRWLGTLLAAAALVNVLMLLEGRTGYLVALTVISLSVMWAMPRRLGLTTLVATPVILLFGLYFGSTQVQERLSTMIHESQTYATQGVSGSSSGWRLNAWHRSVEAIKEKPWLGHGVGSWTMTVKRLEGSSATKVFGEGKASNPHQEYLLWGVELGIAGTLLLLSFMACLVRDALRFRTAIARSTISVVAAMAVACLFNSALYDGLIGDFFCISVGLLLALGIRSEPTLSNSIILAPAPARSRDIT
ncbi:MAG: O-antigen ligase family protein [Rhodoferax sp.]|nr:O-antigen ligase family protein [Rhodoferax sp.]